MCEFHDANCNGLGDMWWTDKCMYFSSIDLYIGSLVSFYDYLFIHCIGTRTYIICIYIAQYCANK